MMARSTSKVGRPLRRAAVDAHRLLASTHGREFGLAVWFAPRECCRGAPTPAGPKSRDRAASPSDIVAGGSLEGSIEMPDDDWNANMRRVKVISVDSRHRSDLVQENRERVWGIRLPDTEIDDRDRQ